LTSGSHDRDMTRSGRSAVGVLAFALIAPLGVVAFVASIAIASRAEVDLVCLLGSTTTHTADLYAELFLVAIAASGIALLALMVALVERISWRVLLVPLVWFAAILASEFLVALAIGPQPCDGGLGI
jgi:hypothetical protein